MVLGGLGYRLDLFRREPFPQVRILTDDPAGGQVMHFPAVHQTGVVESCGGIENILVNVIMNGHIHRLIDHFADVIFPVRLVKSRIARNYLILYILYKFWIHDIHKFRHH